MELVVEPFRMTDGQVKKRGYAYGNMMLFAEKDGDSGRQFQVEEDFTSWSGTLPTKQKRIAELAWLEARWRETKRDGQWGKT